MSSSSTMFLLYSLVIMLLPSSIAGFDITNLMSQYPAYRSYRNYITRKLQYTALPPIPAILPIPVPVPVLSPVPVESPLPVPVVSPVPVPVPVPVPTPFPVPVESPVPVVSPVPATAPTTPTTITTPSPAPVTGPAGVPGPALSPMSPDGAPAANNGEGPKSGAMKSDVNNALPLFLTFTTIYVLMSRSMYLHD
ncbi:unnamed protein product [Lathyrus oleraceus]|uniref:uncharacterized protein LOC127087659 n=1 Tax=Pisum sativum TaxID=3888 RepID=UPI0021CF43BB|nr:uncharacterized protein LOC127087659 [Pisum sativum]